MPALRSAHRCRAALGLAGTAFVLLLLGACSGATPAPAPPAASGAADTALTPADLMAHFSRQHMQRFGDTDNYTAELEDFTVYYRRNYQTPMPLLTHYIEAGVQQLGQFAEPAMLDPVTELFSFFFAAMTQAGLGPERPEQAAGPVPSVPAIVSVDRFHGHPAYVLTLHFDSTRSTTTEHKAWIDAEDWVIRRTITTERVEVAPGTGVPVYTTTEWMDFRPVDSLLIPHRISIDVRGLADMMTAQQRAATQRQIEATRRRLDALPAQKRDGAALILQPQIERMEMLINERTARQVFYVDTVRVNTDVPAAYFPEEPHLHALDADPAPMPDSAGFRILQSIVRRQAERVQGTSGYVSRCDAFEAHHGLLTRRGIPTYTLDVAPQDATPRLVAYEAGTDWNDMVSLYQFSGEDVRYVRRDTLRGHPVDVLRFEAITPYDLDSMVPYARNNRFWVDAETRLMRQVSGESTIRLPGVAQPFWVRSTVVLDDYRTADGLAIPRRVTVTLHPAGRLATAEGQAEARQALAEATRALDARAADETRAEEARAEQEETLREKRALLDHVLGDEPASWTFDLEVDVLGGETAAR